VVARAYGESVGQPVQRHFAAIKIGQNKFHVEQLDFNIAICLIRLYKVCRTRYWKRVPDFNFVDLKVLISAALGPDKLSDSNYDIVHPLASHPLSS